MATVDSMGGSDADIARLHSLGYAQELRRRMSGFSNFAVSFTIISVLSGCLTLVLLRDAVRRVPSTSSGDGSSSAS